MSAFGWAMLAALAWGLAPIVEKAGLRDTGPIAGLFYRCVGVVAGMLILGLFLVRPQEGRAVGLRSALLLAAGGFLASFLGQICFYHALKGGEVSRMVPISASYPFIAFMLGVLLFHESLTPFKIGGALLIVAGVWLLKIG
ncbi:MAG: EamA family transporter [Candidatus Omnitrophica bacterium]|nr:EamA family transporter [Candidatus Omnitrophota bacterium]